MMNTRLNKALIALVAVASVGACDDPPIEPGDNEAARLSTNPSFVVIEAGETRLVQSYLVNALGNPVSGEVAFSACNAAITVADDTLQTDIEPGTNFTITGNTLGSSCVNVSAGSFEKTINVRVVPAALALTVSDTLLSGQSTLASLVFEDSDGGAATGFDLDEVTFESLDEDIAVVDAAGNITAQAPGTGQVVVTLNDGLGAPRADTVTFEVVPGGFAGSMTPDEGPSGTETTVEFAGSDPAFDESSGATATSGFTTYRLFQLDGTDENTVNTVIPYGAAEGPVTVVLSGLGENEVALASTFDVTTRVTNDPGGASNPFLAGTTPRPAVFPGEIVGAIDGTTGEWGDGLIFTSTMTGDVTVTVDWDHDNGSTDMDVYVYNLTAGAYVQPCTNNMRTGNFPESSVCPLIAGNSYLVIIEDYNVTPVVTNYHVLVEE